METLSVRLDPHTYSCLAALRERLHKRAAEHGATVTNSSVIRVAIRELYKKEIGPVPDD